jgi:hypothetical protein
MDERGIPERLKNGNVLDPREPTFCYRRRSGERNRHDEICVACSPQLEAATAPIVFGLPLKSGMRFSNSIGMISA